MFPLSSEIHFSVINQTGVLFFGTPSILNIASKKTAPKEKFLHLSVSHFIIKLTTLTIFMDFMLFSEYR